MDVCDAHMPVCVIYMYTHTHLEVELTRRPSESQRHSLRVHVHKVDTWPSSSPCIGTLGPKPIRFEHMDPHTLHPERTLMDPLKEPLWHP